MSDINRDAGPANAEAERGWKSWRSGLAVGLVIAIVWGLCFYNPWIWVMTGVGDPHWPFMDLHGLLAAIDAHNAGVNAYLPNDFDPYHRPHVYTDWWFVIGEFGLTRDDTAWLGAVLIGLVLVMAIGLVKPRTRFERLGLLFILFSPAMLFTVNRGNNDLVVYLIASLGLLCFRIQRWAPSLLGTLFFAVTAVLKYSPLVTIVLLAELKPRRLLFFAVTLYVLVLVLAWPGLVEGWKSAAQFIPAPSGLYAFGAPVFLRNLDFVASRAWWMPAIGIFLWATWSGGRQACRSGMETEAAARREFICGAAMLVGMFFVGSSYAYKLVSGLWLLPWLWRTTASDRPGEVRWRRVTWWLFLAVMWCEGAVLIGLNLWFHARPNPVALRLMDVAMLVEQVITWAFIACLLRFLMQHARGVWDDLLQGRTSRR